MFGGLYSKAHAIALRPDDFVGVIEAGAPWKNRWSTIFDTSWVALKAVLAKSEAVYQEKGSSSRRRATQFINEMSRTYAGFSALRKLGNLFRIRDHFKGPYPHTPQMGVWILGGYGPLRWSLMMFRLSRQGPHHCCSSRLYDVGQTIKRPK